MLLKLISIALVALAQAAPTLNYPIATQLPPVARVNKPFSFSLLPSTFTSTSNITYTSSTLPSWLSFSPGVETFYGTPALSDVGQTDITVTATDPNGSTSSKWTVIVSNYSAPGIHSSFTTQIGEPPLRVFASATALPGNSGVSVPPYWSFSLGFASDTFRLSKDSNNNGELFFSARQRGAAGLPSWLRFNNDTMTFNGVAPATSGTYTIVGVVSDYWGYTGSQTSFVIEVGQGEGIEWNSKGQNWTDMVGMAGQPVNYTVDMTKFMMGGNTAYPNQLSLSLNNTDFPWLSLSSGIVPAQYINGTISPFSIPLTVSSVDANNTLSLTTWLGLDIVPSLLTTLNLPNASVNPGSTFSFNLSPYVVNKTATISSLYVNADLENDTELVSRAPVGTIINATVSPSDAAKWLTFNTNTLTISGTAPTNPSYSVVDVLFTATQGAYTSTSDLKITMNGVTSTSSSPSGTAAMPTSTSGSSSGSSGGLSKAAKIGLGVGLGILGLLLLLLLLFCCFRRRKQTKKEGKDTDNDGESIIASSPIQAEDPFRKSGTLEPTRNFLGDMIKFSPFISKSPENPTTMSPRSFGTHETAVEKPQRMDQLKGILDWQEKSPIASTPRMNRSNSFIADGDVIGVSDPVNRPSQDASSFTASFESSESSRASWESRRSFQWSSGENELQSNGNLQDNRLSHAPSIPRPRQNFTPRYPRNNSPTALARMTQDHEPDASPEFSEFDSNEHRDDSFGSAGSPGLGSASSSSFPRNERSGLSRRGESGQVGTDDDEGTDHEGPAVVAMAERQSFETRRPQTSERPTIQLKPSREKISQVEESRRERSQKALSGGAFEDAQEAKRLSTYAPSAADSDLQGLGYPANEIYFSSPDPNHRFSGSASGLTERASTIQAIHPSDHQHPLSPPLPLVGSFQRPLHTPIYSQRQTISAEGRLIAMANETFSTHPSINPPPTVSLSAATWSSNPPSTYRAVAEGGLPSWLHFDSRELELWGVPGVSNAGEVCTIRIIEKMPQDKRRSDPMSYGYQPPQEREVGCITIEVVDRLRSPQFALDGSPHAF